VRTRQKGTHRFGRPFAVLDRGGEAAEQILAADLDGDGVLTMADAIKLMRKVLGL
jgi:hypothetical protein